MVTMNTKNVVKKTVGAVLVVAGVVAVFLFSIILFDILTPLWVYSSVDNVMGVYGISEYIGKLIALFFAVLISWNANTVLRKIIKRDKKWVLIVAGIMAVWFMFMYRVSSPYTSGSFNPFSGKAQAVYLRMEDGTIKSFPKGLKFDPDTGRELKEFDPATAEEYQKQQKTGRWKPISRKDNGFLNELTSLLSGRKVPGPIDIEEKQTPGVDMRIEKIQIAPDRTIVVFSAGPYDGGFIFHQPNEIYLTDDQGRVYDLVRDGVSYEVAFQRATWFVPETTTFFHLVRAGEIYRFERVFQPLKPDFSGLEIHCNLWKEQNVRLDDLLIDVEVVPALPPEPVSGTQITPKAPTPVYESLLVRQINSSSQWTGADSNIFGLPAESWKLVDIMSSPPYELVLGDTVISSPLLYADTQTPRKLLIHPPSGTDRGRYTLISLCDQDWCDDTRLLDMNRGLLVPVRLYKSGISAGVTWSPDEKYAVVGWSHGGETGLTCIDLNTLAITNTPAGFSKVFLKDESGDIGERPNSTSPNYPEVSLKTDYASWKRDNRVEIPADILKITWNGDSGNQEKYGQISVVFSIPDLSVVSFIR